MPLGVINVAIVDATVAGRRRFAIGLGIGGACADAIHATLAFVGVGQLVTRRPDVLRILAIAAAALIVAYVVFAWRREKRPVPPVDATTRAVLTGFLLTLPNLGALTAWVAVAASVLPGARIAEATTAGVCVGLGSAAWFALLAVIVSRIPREHRALKINPKVALVALVALAVVGIVRSL